MHEYNARRVLLPDGAAYRSELVQYTNALRLFYVFNNWMVSVQFQPGNEAANPGA